MLSVSYKPKEILVQVIARLFSIPGITSDRLLARLLAEDADSSKTRAGRLGRGEFWTSAWPFGGSSVLLSPGPLSRKI